MPKRRPRTQRQQRPPARVSDTPRHAHWQVPHGAVLLIIGVTLAVFWQVLSHQFVLWDDPVNVSENPALHPVTLDHILTFWRAPYLELYIPLTYTVYVAKLVVPLWLAPDYGRSPAGLLTQHWLWCTGLVPWLLAAVLWWQCARVPWLLVAVGVFVAGLLPVLGFVPFAFQDYSTVADRYTYLALLGPAVALAWLLQRWPRRALAVGCAVLLALLGLCSAWQTRYWHGYGDLV